MNENSEINNVPPPPDFSFLDQDSVFSNSFALTDFPDEIRIEELNAEFRFWHTESLLNQSANLIDQCLKDLSSYKQLQLLEFNVNQEINLRKKEIEVETKRLDQFKRDIILAEYERSLQDERKVQDDNATSHASQSYGYTTNTLPDTVMNGHLKHLARLKDTILWSERQVVDITQKWEKIRTQKQIDWLTRDAQLDEAFFQFRVEELKIKQKQLNDTEALDFSFQKKLCFERLSRNYEDALNRSIIAEIGLDKIYSRQVPLQNKLREPDQTQHNVSALYNWIYESIEFLTAYSQLDQSFTICLSLRSLLTESEFKHLSGQNDRYTANFLVDRSYFPIGTHQNIRFKGIAASLIGNVGTVPWRIEIKLPENAIYLRGKHSAEIAQRDVPSCILGRVENRKSPRGIEYGGTISMNNLSPIAANGDEIPNHWLLTIEKPKSHLENFQNIEDVIIELNLTGKLL